MAKKRGGTAKKQPNAPSVTRSQVSLRQESTGKVQHKGNHKSFLKVEHLQRLAEWASGEASIPSLAAFFGNRVAASREALAIPPEPSLFQCQRCETILQPGLNCTVRIEKTRAKGRRHKHKKANTSTKNNVTYKCHYCSHENQRKGTQKGYIKQICPPMVKPPKMTEPSNSVLQKPASLDEGTSNRNEPVKIDNVVLPKFSADISNTDDPATPVAKSGYTLLDAKKRKRNKSASKRPEQSETDSAATDADRDVSTSKRKRKSWTSLKEIVESNERNVNRNVVNLTIPLTL